jgi:hypothetical protein
MSAYYVDIEGISDEVLEFLGYILVAENDEFQLFINKGKEYVLPKTGARLLYFDDLNDADVMRSRRRAIPAPSSDQADPGAAAASPPVRPAR